jgi:hypothetical protein
MYYIKKEYLGKVRLVRGNEQLLLNEQATQEQLEAFAADPIGQQYIIHQKRIEDGKDKGRTDSGKSAAGS